MGYNPQRATSFVPNYRNASRTAIRKSPLEAQINELCYNCTPAQQGVVEHTPPNFSPKVDLSSHSSK